MERYKRKQKMIKILDLFETIPEIVSQKGNYYFSEAVTETVLDFLELKNKNYRQYPWEKKIYEKRKELFGF